VLDEPAPGASDAASRPAESPTRRSIPLLEATLVILIVAVAIGGVVILLQGGGGSGASEATATPTTATRTTQPTETQAAGDEVASAVCNAVRALQGAQNEDVAPMMSLLGDWPANFSEQPPQSERDQALAHGTAVATVIATYGSSLDGLKSAELGDVIVDARAAYGGYARGMTALRPAFDEPVNASWLDIVTPAMTDLNQGLDDLNKAVDALDRLDASGAVSCPDR
jgi:hypothetical protein